MPAFSDGDLRAATLEMHDLVRRSLLVQAVSVAARLGVADLLDGRALTAEELAEATGADAPTLYRLLRALSGLGLFVEDGEHRFELTPLGASLRSGERSAREVAVFFGEPFVWAAWGDLHHSVMTGEPAFRHTHGVGLFEYVRDDLDAGSAFHGWMTRQSKLQVPVVLAAYDFSRFRKLVDVGGGQGRLLAAILEANPALTGVLYDLPEVVADSVGDRLGDLGRRRDTRVVCHGARVACRSECPAEGEADQRHLEHEAGDEREPANASALPWLQPVGGPR